MFYWHAAGINSDPEGSPHAMEHFGIAVVEGMAFGCVPLVVDNGGPADIVEDGVSGMHYTTQHELAEKTGELLRDERRLDKLRVGALQRAAVFSKEVFLKKLNLMLSSAV
jgi:glycosyltransferase involved in cell wall biosynthesis